MKTKSPKPTKPEKKQLEFTEALKEVLTGKSITKLEWEDKRYYGILVDERLMLHKPDGNLYNWILTEGDMRGDDYVII